MAPVTTVWCNDGKCTCESSPEAWLLDGGEMSDGVCIGILGSKVIVVGNPVKTMAPVNAWSYLMAMG